MNADAQIFRAQLADVAWLPAVHHEEGEVLFEWIGNGRHAVVSIEGDGRIGYAMLRGDRFVSGEVPDPPVTSLPHDLAAYLDLNR